MLLDSSGDTDGPRRRRGDNSSSNFVSQQPFQGVLPPLTSVGALAF